MAYRAARTPTRRWWAPLNPTPSSDLPLGRGRIGPLLPAILHQYRVDFMVSSGSFARALPKI